MRATFFSMILAAVVVAGFNAPAGPRWIIVGVLAVVGAYVIGLNWAIVIRFYRHGNHSSRVPLLGAVLVALAMIMAPATAIHKWSWVPFVADPGSVLMLAQLAWFRP